MGKTISRIEPAKPIEVGASVLPPTHEFQS